MTRKNAKACKKFQATRKTTIRRHSSITRSKTETILKCNLIKQETTAVEEKTTDEVLQSGTLLKVEEMSTDSELCGSFEEEEIDDVFDLKFSLNKDEIDRLNEAFDLLADPFNKRIDFYELAAAME